MDLTRRGMLGILAAGIAPAIIRPGLLMPVKPGLVIPVRAPDALDAAMFGRLREFNKWCWYRRGGIGVRWM